MKVNNNTTKDNTDSWKKLHSYTGLLKEPLKDLINKIHGSKYTLINLNIAKNHPLPNSSSNDVVSTLCNTDLENVRKLSEVIKLCSGLV